MFAKFFKKIAEKSESSEPEQSFFTDPRDGQTYKTVKIGKQVWMAENLNYDDGGVFGHCDYNDNPANGSKYGKLYDGRDVMGFHGMRNERGEEQISPPGWHIPTDQEWKTLISFVGGEEKAGLKLKAKSGWNNNGKEPGNGNDVYGFTALPGGMQSVNQFEGEEFFSGIGTGGSWWSSTQNGDSAACFSVCNLDNKANIGYERLYKKLSIRCVRDGAEFYNRRANTQYNEKNYDAAIENYTKAIELEEAAIYYNNRGNAYYNKGNYDSAIEDYTKAIGLTKNETYYNNRGNTYFKKDNYDSAIEDYSKAIGLAKNEAYLYKNRGNAQYTKKNYDAAIKDYTKAIELAKDDNKKALYYTDRGDAYSKKGDNKSAIKDYTKAAETTPDKSKRTEYLNKIEKLKGGKK